MQRAVAKQFDPELLPGEWYLRYKCASCGITHILFRDLTHGAGQVRATYMIECPTCCTRSAYEGEDIERYHNVRSGESNQPIESTRRT